MLIIMKVKKKITGSCKLEELPIPTVQDMPALFSAIFSMIVAKDWD